MRATVAILLLALATPALAQSTLTREQRAQALEHVNAGSRKFDVAKFDEAAKEFVQAYEISGSAEILYNIGQAYRQGEQHEKALYFYRACYRHKECFADRRAEVERKIAELTTVVAQAKNATVSPPNGTVALNESTDPKIKPTERKVGNSVEQTPTPPATTPSETPNTVQPSSTPSTEPQAASHGPDRVLMKRLGIGLAGVAAVGFGLGIGMSVAAMKDSQNVSDASSHHIAFGPNLQASQKNGQLYDSVSYVGYALGGAALIGSAVTLYFGLRHPAATAQARVTPVLGPNIAGLQIEGRF